MSFATLLISVCTVRRYTAGAQNPYDGRPAETWADHLTDEPCRLMAGVGRGNTGTGMEVRIGAKLVVADYILFIGDVDITEQDRVIIDTVEYEILMVANRQNGTTGHHRECYLKTVR